MASDKKVARMFGKREAVRDQRLSAMEFRLPTADLGLPPPSANWYAAVGYWRMMKNDTEPCCVIAAFGHAIMQMSTYAGKPLIMTDDEVMENFTACGGDADGLYVLGPGGALPYWIQNGLKIGGTINKPDAAVRVNPKDHNQLRHAINKFGGVLAGFQLTEGAADPATFVWNDPGAPVLGGHEVWMDGYEVGPSGYTVYDIVSWGGRCRATEDYVTAQCDEAVSILDLAEFDKRMLDGGGVPRWKLIADMSKFGPITA